MGSIASAGVDLGLKLQISLRHCFHLLIIAESSESKYIKIRSTKTIALVFGITCITESETKNIPL